jgi:hypothetical protein
MDRPAGIGEQDRSAETGEQGQFSLGSFAETSQPGTGPSGQVSFDRAAWTERLVEADRTSQPGKVSLNR